MVAIVVVVLRIVHCQKFPKRKISVFFFVFHKVLSKYRHLYQLTEFSGRQQVEQQKRYGNQFFQCLKLRNKVIERLNSSLKLNAIRYLLFL